MITATLNKNWRDECFGKTDFDKLEYFLMMAYHVCKDIDSTNWFGCWPDDVRGDIAHAWDMIREWNTHNELNVTNSDNEEDKDGKTASKV